MNKPLKERARARARAQTQTHMQKSAQCYGIAKQKLDALRTFRDKTRR
jgi:hypothetical protein